MLILNLRWVIFGLLLAAAVISLVVWMDHRRLRRAEEPFLSLGEMRKVLDQAPFGWVVLNRPDACCYANGYARRLLGLSSQPGPLPDAEWAALLDDDLAMARQEGAPSVVTAA